ncbi:hypothetical protein [Aeromonas salmonicida]|uniref:hypothetical protein n=1 Tax=Aeromonas salmonicida TaxID=645 RepID=UPI00232DCD58|nr:hypothetical protein [Aeromonas salmonicida]WCH25132.1 hypothetical protein ONZ54_22970 [Aeromonas salmonicida]
MGRQIEVDGQCEEVDEYLPEHYLENQTSWAAPGIPLNPKLREDFDNTPNEERDPLELKDWWRVPYIKTIDWAAFASSDEEHRRSWFEAWPTGIRYDVRCLDGGAWDRSTNKGAFPTLEQAITAAQALLGK